MNLHLLESGIVILINTFGVFLLIIMFANSLKEHMYKWFVIMTLLLLAWVDFAYLGSNSSNVEFAILSYRINAAMVSMFFVSVYMFYIEKYLNIKKAFLRNLIIFLGVFFSIASVFTKYVVTGVVVQSWGNELQFGFLEGYFLLFALLTTSVYVYFFITRYITLADYEKHKVRYFLIGIFLLIIFNVIFNIVLPSITGSSKYQHFGDYSSVAFLAFTTFAILRKQFLNIKVALAAFLISVIGMFLLFDMFILSSSSWEILVKGFILLSFIIISIVLVQSITNEAKQKEILVLVNSSLKRTNRQLANANQRERDIIDIMGHELRTPLSILRIDLGLLENLLNSKAPKELRLLMDTNVVRMKNALQREVRLLETLLTSTKVDVGKVLMNFEKVNIIDVINDSIIATQNKAIEKGLKLTLESGDKEIFVFADRVRLAEVVDNLVINAVKYTNEGSVKIDVKTNKNFATISVIDTGVGIPKEDQKHLGQKFFRVAQHVGEKSDRIVRPGGTGLGLYVSMNLVKMMSGKFGVKSTLNKGSTFFFTVPLYTNQKPEDGVTNQSKNVFDQLGLHK